MSVAKHTPYIEQEHRMGGIQRRYRFENGYEASVIKTSFSYGGNDGLWELAVMGPDGEIDYTTPVTTDVIGHLSDSDLDDTLDLIAALPAKTAEA
jgi:hypothetical protein